MLDSILGIDYVQLARVMLDVFTLSVIFYFVYRLFRAVKIPLLLNQIISILLVYIIAAVFRFETVLWVLNKVSGWIIIAIIVIFQPELRALVMRTDYAKLFRRDKSNRFILPDFDKIKNTIEYLIKMKRGALFVFPRHIDLEYIITSKVEINAHLNEDLLQTIFGYDTVLHDGAVIIKNNKITHAGCFLPTERTASMTYNLGSRHRAALGLSQNSDAIILVLSEEYGSVSLVFDGEILYDIGIEKSCAYLEQQILEISEQEQSVEKTEAKPSY